MRLVNERRNARSWATTSTVPSKRLERRFEVLARLDVQVIDRLVKQ